MPPPDVTPLPLAPSRPGPAALAVRPRHQHFSLAHVRLFLRAVLQLPTSLRAAAAIFPLLGEEGWASADMGDGPSAPCGRGWLLRVGLYELRRPKEQADDWIWFVDHTIQLGTIRVLLIVGVRLSAWEAQGRGPLKQGDLQVILLDPVEKSNAEVVRSQLERAAQITGIPLAIVCDQCRELNNGIGRFQTDHPRTLRLNDLKHRLALLLERRLKPDPRSRRVYASLPADAKEIAADGVGLSRSASHQGKSTVHELGRTDSLGHESAHVPESPGNACRCAARSTASGRRFRRAAAVRCGAE